VALHRAADLGDGTRCELSLVVDRSLEEIVARLEAAGVAIERGISDEAFGRSILLRDPDGTALQVNEHE
jgi:catechol-2,3-dioxygenase